MARLLYFDCFSGISGDMTLGALLACGADEERLRSELAKLKLPGWQLSIAETSRNGIGATDVTVNLTAEQGHGRHLHHIEEILNASEIAQPIREKALAVFRRLAEAEAKIHQTTVERIHFHEVGAVDAIIDIVGACVALENLGVEQVICSPLPMSRGFVDCMHGTIPLPAPAVLELLKDVPVYGVDVEGEMVTPTGAAIMTTLAARFGSMPPMTVHATGYGAGTSDFGNRPNLLRVVIGDTVADALSGAAEVVALETNLLRAPLRGALRGRRARRVSRADPDEEGAAGHAPDGALRSRPGRSPRGHHLPQYDDSGHPAEQHAPAVPGP